VRNGAAKRRLLVRLLKEQGGICGLCRRPILEGEERNLDHVTPVARDGSSSVSNLQVTHVACNKEKGAGERTCCLRCHEQGRVTICTSFLGLYTHLWYEHGETWDAIEITWTPVQFKSKFRRAVRKVPGLAERLNLLVYDDEAPLQRRDLTEPRLTFLEWLARVDSEYPLRGFTRRGPGVMMTMKGA